MQRNFRHFYNKSSGGGSSGGRGSGPSKKSYKGGGGGKDSGPPPYVLTAELKAQIYEVAYLGKKGYTIPKVAVPTAEFDFLKEDLMMRPYVFGGAPVDAFPVYRENAAKIYLPRFYGIARYGMPKRSELLNGEDIAVEFAAPLRDYQDKIIDIYMTHIGKGHIEDSSIGQSSSGGAILEVPCGRGKTVMALKIISLIGKKTLILVHKEFLMNQWIERAAQFIPKAKIGKIQGGIFDVEGKDVVIGMIQTMYSRDFPAGTFDAFGLTIIDEVHRIGSEEFSKTLLKTVTPYMLGISATVDRKDRLTKILYMFIGPKIYEEDRDDEDPVVVRGIEYVTRDEGFAETEYDFRGTPKFSTMISKLCDYGPRSDFIVRVIADLITENPQNQIMVLAHNRSLLKYIYEAIGHRGIGTAGYYLGGMKEADLKETESKQIVIATYAMAAEALDIKSLSTLVMATPKTDIEQSVGRILRERHSNPIVVDIVDMHDLFKNQWRTRKTFYRKCNYRVLYIPSTKYGGFISVEGGSGMGDWKVEFEPKKKGACEVVERSKPIGKCLIKLEE
jgi:superfamily II DNA or RNA helicase